MGIRSAVKTKKINIFAMLFVGLVCVSLLVLHGWITWSGYQKGMEDARTQVSNLANSQAQQAEDAIMSADVVLNGIVQRLEIEAISPTALTRLYPMLVSQIHDLPHFHGIFVYGSDGGGLVSSMSDISWNMADYDREYFRFHSTNPDRSLHIGAPIRSRLTGDPVIPVSRRLNYPDGSFAGVILATIYVDYFQQFYRSFDNDNNMTVVLGMASGEVLAQYPNVSSKTNTNSMHRSALFQHLIEKSEPGISTMRSPVDHDKHIVSFERIKKYPLYVMTDMPLRKLLERWRYETFVQTLIMLLLFVFFMLTGSHLVKQIIQRSKTEDALRQARTDLVTLNQALQKQALEDGLTRIPNRRNFDNTLESEFQRAKRSQTPLSLLMIDVDHFKKYNDTYGHVAGDKCLQQIAKLIQTNRSGDLSARYGGEEFAVLLPSTDLHGAHTVAEMIRQNVMDQRIPHSKNIEGIVTVSIGTYTQIPDLDENLPYKWVGFADEALYRAKANGRNRIETTHAPATRIHPDNVGI